MQAIDSESFIKMKIVNERSISDCNLTEKNIENVMVNHSCFDRVDMSGANIKSTRFRDCDLNAVLLDNVIAISMIMRLCRLKNLSAIEANFNQAKIENCSVQGGDFSRTLFEGASLIETDFSRSSFERANLTNASFEGCNLRGGDFRGAIVTNTSFRDADLRGADFVGASIKSADFSGADLRGTIFDADVEAALFGEEKVKQVPVELVDAVAPIVASLLKQAEANLAIESNKWMEELLQTLAEMGASSLDEERVDQWDEQVSFWLNQAGKVGMDELFESLRSGEEKTPEAIASMLEGFVKEQGLQAGASTGDVFEALISKLRNS